MRILGHGATAILAALSAVSVAGAMADTPNWDELGGKCLTPYLVDARLRLPGGMEMRRAIFQGRPSTEMSVLTRSGRFRIHYDTSSTSQHVPAMVDAEGKRVPFSTKTFVDTLGEILDSVWRAEVTMFSFLPPPGDGNAGGGVEYDIYVQDLGPNNFGFTQPESSLVDPPGRPNPRCPSYIVVDNDFGAGFRTKGIAAVCVTAAHEFFHAIQVGGYGFWEESEFYFYELTAESMESVVFPSVRDYIKDIPIYFSNVETIPLYSSGTYPGYERAIWGIYLVRQYGIWFMRQIWEQISKERPFAAMADIFAINSVSLEQSFSTFTLWNFYTGVRADTALYYSDGGLFPPLSLSAIQNISLGGYAFLRMAKSYTAQYLQTFRNTDSVVYVITNVDTKDALSATHQEFRYTLDVSPSSVSGWPSLPNGMSYRFTVDDARAWSVVPLRSAGLFSSSETAPFPNPFNPEKSSIFFPIPGGTPPHATLYVLSPAMELVAEVTPMSKNISGRQCLEWNGRTGSGSVVPSGVYFYLIKDEGVDVRGKIAVIR